jgi:hypothetical protein
MASPYDESSVNQYAHCPTMPIHTPIEGPLNCNIDFDVDKVYDNYVFPVLVANNKQIEHFDRNTKCTDFLIKLIIFVTIMWFIIYILLQK